MQNGQISPTTVGVTLPTPVVPVLCDNPLPRVAHFVQERSKVGLSGPLPLELSRRGLPSEGPSVTSQRTSPVTLTTTRGRSRTRFEVRRARAEEVDVRSFRRTGDIVHSRWSPVDRQAVGDSLRSRKGVEEVRVLGGDDRDRDGGGLGLFTVERWNSIISIIISSRRW